ncbi:hypothetical protein CCFV1_ORF087 [Cotesia congregata filamentous virus 1]|uniref:Uncharacterized protein n=1 Tax=Cotesia congregata filamentous virus 1 TaxID=3064291 RepID=A0ABC8QJY1_9VIRU|nr:hypothetical protein CCFV1_ORF087 [Cotesia congregata filamentous virus 1]
MEVPSTTGLSDLFKEFSKLTRINPCVFFNYKRKLIFFYSFQLIFHTRIRIR